MEPSLWRSLARPRYLVSAGPWAALLALLSPLAVWAALGLVVGGFLAGLAFLLSQVADGLPVGGGLVGLVLVLYLLAVPFLLLAAIPLFGLWFGRTERWRLRLMGFANVADPHVPMPLRPFRRWLVFRYQEPATWREVLSAVISEFFCLFVTVLLLAQAAVLALFAGCLVSLLVLHEPVDQAALGLWGAPSFFGVPDGVFTEQDWWVFALLLLVCLAVFAYLNGLVAAASGSLSKALLAPRPEEIQRQVDRLTFSRAAIMESFEAERRRIERDLHDGVQQELVNLSLRLGMAEMELETLREQGADTGAATRQVREAQDQTGHALQTLRNTVRGIYPAVLEDHGLRPALEELAENCLLPVRLEFDAVGKLPADVERTAYYTVNEAMTNALKHAGASRLRILARTAEGCLLVEVEDDGVGGADPARGSGISGLDERAQALGGSVRVDSPRGGPTRLRLRLPLDGGEQEPLAPWPGIPREAEQDPGLPWARSR